MTVWLQEMHEAGLDEMELWVLVSGMKCDRCRGEVDALNKQHLRQQRGARQRASCR